jgi:ring-1,2-phenylacetyl-CoA epoxidase subunit PaaD
MRMMVTNQNQAMEILKQVMDPEIPTLSIVDLGMVEDVRVDAAGVHIDLMPTFLGCPALDMIRERVEAAFPNVQTVVKFIHTKPWTSDLISIQGRESLREWGIAPPAAGSGNPVLCPFCGSGNTSRSSHFGSSLCRSLYYCQDCAQPFEHMKTI